MTVQLVHGKLLKRDRTFHTWKLRHVRMDKDSICCVNNRGARRGELHRSAGILPGGAMDISIRLFEAPKPFGFELRVRDEKLFFAADSDNDRDRWVDALVAHWGASLDQASVNISTDRDRNPALLRFTATEPQPAPPALSSTHPVEEDDDAPLILPTVLGPLIETASTIQFPSVLKATGDVLMGVGPFIRRVRWTYEPILAVALYIDSTAVSTTFDAFRGRSLASLYDDPSFYSCLLDSRFRKTFVFSCRKRLSRSALTTALHDELRPRIGSGAVDELVELMTFVDKSLRKGESMICTIHPDATLLDFHFKGLSHPSLVAPALCRCIPALFFDANSIQTHAKRGLIERMPYLWGLLPAFPTSFSPRSCRISLPKDFETDDECDQEEEDEGEDERDDDEEEEEEDGDGTNNDDDDDMVPFSSTFGPLIDLTSAVVFPGTLAASSISGGTSIVLLGTCGSADEGEARWTVGLYVDAAGASSHLVRFKGLSFGSLAADPDFSMAFTTGAFVKFLRFWSSCPLVRCRGLLRCWRRCSEMRIATTKPKP
ncbi:hypothetical protein H257_14923 [Aphanomyces astaci]|uniref:PH domain-containing protein n=1 Tax=Aphanomyces astaci TaxID=112090 RepID=W4FQR9_APHAT|nr:hypothetical protein H257_14923 [Aphanomyces astaci]ETV69296.1 hypothetical protein H257_14923 [Aphanomyces astaci]|eukprot:XP_009841153.1 hypothetical protein H257_14923 [Aphanomyces astaci]